MDIDGSPSSSPQLGARSPKNIDGSMNWLLGGSSAESSTSVNSNNSRNFNYQQSSLSHSFSNKTMGPLLPQSYSQSGSLNFSGSVNGGSYQTFDRLHGTIPQNGAYTQPRFYQHGFSNNSNSSNSSGYHSADYSASGSRLQKNNQQNNLRSSLNNQQILRSSLTREEPGFNLPSRESIKRTQSITEEPVDILSQSVWSSTGNIAGLYALEVWRFDKSTGELLNLPIMAQNDQEFGGKFRRPSTSMYLRRTPQESDPVSPDFNSEGRDAFERLTDLSRLDYFPPTSTRPGVGLAGLLWSEATVSTALKVVRDGVHSISNTVHNRIGRRKSVDPELYEEEESPDHIVWREVNTLAQDPLQPYDERLQLQSKAGFGLAAGIPFDIHGIGGLVIFFANPHMDNKGFRCMTNSRLIRFSSQLIGASVAIQNPIIEAKAKANKMYADNWRRLKVKMVAVAGFLHPLTKKKRRARSNSYSPQMRRSNSIHQGLKRVSSFMTGGMNREKSFQMLREATTHLKRNIRTSVVDTQYAAKARGMKWWSKVQGGNAGIPPSFNMIQCMWTFIGSMITHAILSWMNEVIVERSEGKLTLVFAPLGALTTLQYNLTAAPPSQPRNAILSQVLSMFTVYALYQFPTLDSWHRTALAPAIVETLTAKLGIIHPPAGAAAIAFSAGHYQVEHMAIFLLGVCVAIITAVVINNLSDKRQYPTSWPILREVRATWDSCFGG